MVAVIGASVPMVCEGRAPRQGPVNTGACATGCQNHADATSDAPTSCTKADDLFRWAVVCCITPRIWATGPATALCFSRRWHDVSRAPSVTSDVLLCMVRGSLRYRPTVHVNLAKSARRIPVNQALISLNIVHIPLQPLANWRPPPSFSSGWRRCGNDSHYTANILSPKRKVTFHSGN